ncbi:MAG TPA: potassium-transporting ATPase subunit KdpC [Bryobacteraceae bacterium]|jgi:K+-transporting ATPase ATPase C chain|nr:potassium-transporting ATPase subunit KdpC [Bryobacteraceae bacterium]
MKQILIPAVGLTLVLTIITGLIYPLVVTGLAQMMFHHQANGSLIVSNGKIVGSELIGQKFTKPEYFHGRPSGAGDGYDAANSGATNLGPTNQALINRVRDDIKKFRQENPTYTDPIPADLLAMSASGLDPHISPASAYAQVDRVAKARGVPADIVRQAVERHIEGMQFGVLGEPRVNVLLLNLDLDRHP